MRFEWDEAKRLLNRAKHGFDFADAERIEWDYAMLAAVQREAGEERELIYAPLDGSLVVVVAVMRGAVMRLISMRAATKREKQQFYDAIG